MTLYLANPCGPAAIEAMQAGQLGYIDTPAQGNGRPAGVTWAADNGCFGKGYPGDLAWLAWLKRNQGDAAQCLFATAPDVVGDAEATLARSRPFLNRVRAMGYPVALVAQDGMEKLQVPWSDFDALFIGGSTEWKLGRWAALLTAAARLNDKHVHMGRVNSLKRWKYATSIGCDSVDGTYLVYGPDKNLPRLLGWVDTIRGELAA